MILGATVEIKLSKTTIQVVVDLNQQLIPGCLSNKWTIKTWWWVAWEWEWTQCNNNNKWWWCVSNKWMEWIWEIRIWWDKVWTRINSVEWVKWTRWTKWIIWDSTIKWILWVDKWEWGCSNNKWASTKIRWIKTWWEIIWVADSARIWEWVWIRIKWIRIKITMHLGLWTSECSRYKFEIEI